MKGFIIFFLLFVFTSCSKENKGKEESFLPFILKNNKDNILADLDPNIPPPPPPKDFVYGHYNFILTKDEVYFYEIDFIPWRCIVSEDELLEDPLIDIESYKSRYIENDSLSSFLKGKIIKEIDKILVVGTTTDTITNNAFYVIRDYLKKEEFVRSMVRKITSQEKLKLEKCKQLRSTNL